MKLLLEKGADVEPRIADGRTPLSWAARERARGGGEAAAREGGRRQRAGRTCTATPLQAASENGHEAVVKLLLEKGADVNAQGGHVRQRAAGGIERGTRGGGEAAAREGGRRQRAGRRRTATRCRRLRTEATRRWCSCCSRRGPTSTRRVEQYGNALQAASVRRPRAGGRAAARAGAPTSTRKVETTATRCRRHQSEATRRWSSCCSSKGADVNAQGGEYGNALQAASSEATRRWSSCCSSKGADVNAQGGDYGNALQAASHGGHEKVVELLLEQGRRRQRARWRLRQRAAGGIVRRPREGGRAAARARAPTSTRKVDTTATRCRRHPRRPREGGRAAARQGRRRQRARWRLRQRAAGGIGQRPREGGRAAARTRAPTSTRKVDSVRQRAAGGIDSGHETVVRLLLDKGADVDAKDGHGRTALTGRLAAGTRRWCGCCSSKGPTSTRRMDDGRTALTGGIESGHEAVVRLLLEKGADVDAKAEVRTDGAARRRPGRARGGGAAAAGEGGGRRREGRNYGWTALHGAAGAGTRRWCGCCWRRGPTSTRRTELWTDGAARRPRGARGGGAAAAGEGGGEASITLPPPHPPPSVRA